MDNSFFFPHDNNAAQDEKLLCLREKYGWEGYGIFWVILEAMSRNDGYAKKKALGGLCVAYGLTKEWLKEFLESCVGFELFQKDDIGYFSNRIIKQLEKRESAITKGRMAANKRWENIDKTCPPNADPLGTPIQGEDRIGEERIVNTDPSGSIRKSPLPSALAKADNRDQRIDQVISAVQEITGMPPQSGKTRIHIFNWVRAMAKARPNDDPVEKIKAILKHCKKIDHKYHSAKVCDMYHMSQHWQEIALIKIPTL